MSSPEAGATACMTSVVSSTPDTSRFCSVGSLTEIASNDVRTFDPGDTSLIGLTEAWLV